MPSSPHALARSRPEGWRVGAEMGGSGGEIVLIFSLRLGERVPGDPEKQKSLWGLQLLILDLIWARPEPLSASATTNRPTQQSQGRAWFSERPGR